MSAQYGYFGVPTICRQLRVWKVHQFPAKAATVHKGGGFVLANMGFYPWWFLWGLCSWGFCTVGSVHLPSRDMFCKDDKNKFHFTKYIKFQYISR